MDFFSGKIKKYSKLILDLGLENIKSSDEDEDKEFGKIIKNVLLDREGLRALTKAKLNREDELIANRLFRPFSEIASSYETIQNIAVYMSIFPFQKKGISRYSYLRYHIENYLQELYILKERLIKYLKNIERAYIKSSITDEIATEARKLETLVNKGFEGYVKTRSSHVHQYRYSDQDIDRLSLFDIFSKSQDKKFVQIIEWGYKEVFKDIRKKWKSRINEDSKAILKLLDIYFATLYKVLTLKGKLIYPWDK